MENLYEAIVEPDSRIRLKSEVSLEKGLKVVVALPCQETDSSISWLVLGERSLADDWLNTEEDKACAHLQ